MPFFGSYGWARFGILVDKLVEDTAGGYGLGLLFLPRRFVRGCPLLL